MVDEGEAGGVEGVGEEVEGRGLVGGLEDVGDVGEEDVGEEVSRNVVRLLLICVIFGFMRWRGRMKGIPSSLLLSGEGIR